MKPENKLTKATSLYFVGNVFVRLASFILMPLYVNILSLEQFGDYALIMAIYAVLNVVYQGGLLQGFTKYFFEKDSERGVVVSTTFNTLFLLGLIFSVIFTFSIRPLTSLFNFNAQLRPLLLFLAWLLLLDSLAFFSLHLLRTEQLAKKAVTYSIINALVNIVLNLFFLLVLKLGIFGILLAQGGANLVLLLLCLGRVREGYKLRIDCALFKRLIYFSLPLMLAGLCGILMDVADRFIIDIYIDRSTVGIYSLAYKIGLVMSLFVTSFRTAYLPHFLNLNDDVQFAQGKKEKSDFFFSQLKLSFLKLTGVMALIFVGVIVVLPYLFKLKVFGYHLLNENYLPAVAVVPYILLAYVFNGYAAFFSIGPYISGQSRHFLVTDLIGLGVNIILNLILIPKFGMVGAAVATMFAFFVATLYIFLIFLKDMRSIRQ